MKIKVLNFSEEPDSAGDIISENSEVSFPSVVGLYSDFNVHTVENYIGNASLKKESDGLFIENINITNPFFTDIGALTPAISGVVHLKEEKLLKKFTVEFIALTLSPNADKNIKSVGEQAL